MGKASLKLLVVEAKIMCVLETEDISDKGEKKKYFKGKKRKSDYSVLQYGSLKNLMKICLHCTGVSYEGETSSYFPKPFATDYLRAITESCAAFMAHGYSINVCKSMEGVAFYVGISKCCLYSC